MLDGSRRGYMIADEIVNYVCLLPHASAALLAQDMYLSLKARGYGNIDPQQAFVDSFIRRWLQSEHRFESVA